MMWREGEAGFVSSLQVTVMHCFADHRQEMETEIPWMFVTC